MKNRKGIIPIALGVLLVIGAGALVVHNACEDNSALEKSEAIVLQLTEQISAAKTEIPTVSETDIPAGVTVEKEPEAPYYQLNPDIEMPTQTIEGNDYIGVLSIPASELTLPVMSEYSDPALKTAPCRYFGSAYQNNLVIAAHNYRAHFGNISDLNSGDEVIFTDVDGNVFVYEVVETEVLPANAVSEMTCGEWDLTLFTCTYSGSSRVTVRCDIKSF